MILSGSSKLGLISIITQINVFTIVAIFDFDKMFFDIENEFN